MKLRLVVYSLYKQFEQIVHNKRIADVYDNRITNFLILLHIDYNLSSINHNFVFKYLVYQYDYWLHKTVENSLHSTSVVNVFGKKAYTRFIDIQANDKFNWYNAYNHLKSLGIDKHLLNQFITDQKKDPFKIHQDEEYEKTVFVDAATRLLHCLNSTTLYNHKSEICITCTNKKQCKILLKNTNYQLFLDRRYETSLNKTA